MKKILIFSLIFMFFSTLASAQLMDIKWPKPKKNEFKINSFNGDSSFPVIILKERADMYFGTWRGELRLFYQVHRRYKIIDPTKAQQFINYSRRFISMDNFEEFAQFKAFVYSIKNGKISRHRVKHKFYKTTRLNNYVSEINFSVPNLQKGQIVDLIYTFTTFLFLNPDTWFFQKYNIPTLQSDFYAYIPTFMTYYFHVAGKDKLYARSQTNSYTTFTWTNYYKDPIPSGLSYSGYNFIANANFTFDSYFYHLGMKNIPPFHSEKYLDNPDNYRYNVNILLYQLKRQIQYNSQLDQFLWELYTKRLYLTTVMDYFPMTHQESQIYAYPAGFYIFDASSWPQLANSLRHEPSFYKQINSYLGLIDTVRKLTVNTNNDLDKAKNIFNWVRHYFTWNNYYSIFATTYLKKIVKRKKGASSDLNLILVHMLQHANLDAFPVLVKTVDKGHLFTDVAAHYQFNNVIAGVKINNKTILLDATSNLPWYILPNYDHNQIGFAVTRDSSFFIQLKDPITSQITVTENINLNNYKISLTPSLQGRYKLLPASNFIDSTLKKSIIAHTDSGFIVRPFLPFIKLKNIFPIFSRQYPVYLTHNSIQKYIINIYYPDSINPPNINPNFQISTANASLKLTPQYLPHRLKLILTLKLDSYYFTLDQFPKLYQIFNTFEQLRYIKLPFRKQTSKKTEK